MRPRLTWRSLAYRGHGLVSSRRVLYGIKGHVAEASNHQQRQLGQTDADDEQQRTAQKYERRPGEEQPRGGGAERVQHCYVMCAGVCVCW